MTQRIRVGVLFGGRSAEHEVSLRSAASVIAAMDRSLYEVLPIKIRKDGRWEIPAASEHDFLEGFTGDESKAVTLLADPTSPELVVLDSQGVWKSFGAEGRLDVIFPVLHGTYGEDGTLQGFLDLAGVPYVGAGTAASAVGMDKAIMKALFRDVGLPVVANLVIPRFEWEHQLAGTLSRIEERLSYPLFVKPANLGSSVGVNKAGQQGELTSALEEAFRYDHKAIVEEGIDAREIEVSVLGNDEPQASLPGEIVPAGEFYDYKAKYIDDTSELLIPAPLDEETTARARQLAVATFQALDCAGMARVDFLLDRASGRLYVNELNTIPGFTSISMYPKLWEATGVPMTKLVDRLIQLAIEQFQKRSVLETHYPGAAPPSA